MQTTVATFLCMSQAFAIDGSRTMCAAQVGHRHLWLSLYSLKERKQRLLMNTPISSESLFGPDVQTMIDRLEATWKMTEQLGSHLHPQQQQQQHHQQRPRRHHCPGERSSDRSTGSASCPGPAQPFLPPRCKPGRCE